MKRRVLLILLCFKFACIFAQENPLQKANLYFADYNKKDKCSFEVTQEDVYYNGMKYAGIRFKGNTGKNGDKNNNWYRLATKFGDDEICPYLRDGDTLKFKIQGDNKKYTIILQCWDMMYGYAQFESRPFQTSTFETKEAVIPYSSLRGANFNKKIVEKKLDKEIPNIVGFGIQTIFTSDSQGNPPQDMNIDFVIFDIRVERTAR